MAFRTGIAAAWIMSLAAVSALTWYLQTTLAVSGAVEPIPAVQPKDDTEADALRQENEALKAQLAQFRKERDDAQNDTLRMALSQALRSMAEQPTQGAARPKAAQDTWTSGFRSLTARQQRGGGYGSIDEGLNLIMNMANQGAAGIDHLQRIVADSQRSMKERETALYVLSHIRDRRALAALLTLREPDVMELDYPYDLIAPQLSALPTSQIREFIPQIVNQIRLELGADNIAPERSEVLALLALAHQDREAQALLYDQRLLQEDASGAAEVASQVHSRDARRFVEWLAKHASQNVARVANEILEQW